MEGAHTPQAFENVNNLWIKKGIFFSCGFINNKYGLIFTKLFRRRKGWQLRRRLHGNCKEVINKAWSGDIWKCDSRRNENNLTKYYPGLCLTQGQLKKEMSVAVDGMPGLKITIARVLFCLAGESRSGVQVEENVFILTQTMCWVWMNIKRNKINLIICHGKKKKTFLSQK